MRIFVLALALVPSFLLGCSEDSKDDFTISPWYLEDYIRDEYTAAERKIRRIINDGSQFDSKMDYCEAIENVVDTFSSNCEKALGWYGGYYGPPAGADWTAEWYAKRRAYQLYRDYYRPMKSLRDRCFDLIEGD